MPKQNSPSLSVFRQVVRPIMVALGLFVAVGMIIAAALSWYSPNLEGADASASRSVTVGGIKYYEVDFTKGETAQSVCGTLKLFPSRWATDPQVCRTLEGTSRVATSSSGDVGVAFCSGNESGECAKHRNTCLSCPSCTRVGTNSIGFNEDGSNLYQKMYISCSRFAQLQNPRQYLQLNAPSRAKLSTGQQFLQNNQIQNIRGAALAPNITKAQVQSNLPVFQAAAGRLPAGTQPAAAVCTRPDGKYQVDIRSNYSTPEKARMIVGYNNAVRGNISQSGSVYIGQTSDASPQSSNYGAGIAPDQISFVIGSDQNAVQVVSFVWDYEGQRALTQQISTRGVGFVGELSHIQFQIVPLQGRNGTFRVDSQRLPVNVQPCGTTPTTPTGGQQSVVHNGDTYVVAQGATNGIKACDAVGMDFDAYVMESVEAAKLLWPGVPVETNVIHGGTRAAYFCAANSTKPDLACRGNKTAVIRRCDPCSDLFKGTDTVNNLFDAIVARCKARPAGSPGAGVKKQKGDPVQLPGGLLLYSFTVDKHTSDTQAAIMLSAATQNELAHVVTANPDAGTIDVDNMAGYPIGALDFIDSTASEVTVSFTLDLNKTLGKAIDVNNAVLEVVVNDVNGAVSRESTDPFSLDTMPPDLRNFRFTSATATSQSFAWDKAIDTNDGIYEIIFGTVRDEVLNETGNAQKLTISGFDTQTGTIDGLTVGQRYYYKLNALDAFANKSSSTILTGVLTGGGIGGGGFGSAPGGTSGGGLSGGFGGLGGFGGFGGFGGGLGGFGSAPTAPPAGGPSGGGTAGTGVAGGPGTGGVAGTPGGPTGGVGVGGGVAGTVGGPATGGIGLGGGVAGTVGGPTTGGIGGGLGGILGGPAPTGIAGGGGGPVLCSDGNVCPAGTCAAAGQAPCSGAGPGGAGGPVQVCSPGVIIGLPVGLRAVLLDGTDVQLAPQQGTHLVRFIGPSNKPIVEVPVDFCGNVQLGSVKSLRDDLKGAAMVHFPDQLRGNRSLTVAALKRPEHDRLRICPGKQDEASCTPAHMPNLLFDEQGNLLENNGNVDVSGIDVRVENNEWHADVNGTAVQGESSQQPPVIVTPVDPTTLCAIPQFAAGFICTDAGVDDQGCPQFSCIEDPSFNQQQPILPPGQAPDTDGDGVPDDQDNCPQVPNTSQADTDNDGQGNRCDNDVDGDGIPNDQDPDVDGDGNPNGSDPDVNGDGTPNGQDPDADGDGIPNNQDPDVDGDNTSNGNDDDVDGDGTPNENDSDIDGDGIPNHMDDDADGDGVPNGQDPDIDGDGKPNGQDPDTDGDGQANDRDPDIDGDGTPNGSDPDTDGDGIPNGQDDDVDGDGVPNGQDDDVDGDGAPNDQDNDVDGDGEDNATDTDVDGDGTTNSADNDKDGDGVPDDQDDDPLGENNPVVPQTLLPSAPTPGAPQSGTGEGVLETFRERQERCFEDDCTDSEVVDLLKFYMDNPLEIQGLSAAEADLLGFIKTFLESTEDGVNLFDNFLTRSEAIELAIFILLINDRITPEQLESMTISFYPDVDVEDKHIPLATLLNIVRGYKDGLLRPEELPKAAEIYQIVVETSALLSDEVRAVLDIMEERYAGSIDWFQKYKAVLEYFGIYTFDNYDDLGDVVSAIYYLTLIRTLSEAAGIDQPLSVDGFNL